MGLMAGTMMTQGLDTMADAYHEHENKNLKMLQAILDELKAIHKETQIIKEALIFHPDGPGACAVHEHFHSIL